MTSPNPGHREQADSANTADVADVHDPAAPRRIGEAPDASMHRPDSPVDTGSAKSKGETAGREAVVASRRRVGLVATLGIAATAVSAPGAALAVALLSDAPPFAVDLVLLAMISAAMAVGGLRALYKLLRGRPGIAHPGRVALVAVCVQGVAAVGLDRAAPFRWGLLSLVLYSAPALLAAAAATARWRTALAVCAAAAVGLGLCAPSLGAAQQHWYADQWLAAHHIPSNVVVEVIDVPGLRQLPYTYDQGARQLTAEYDGSLDGVDGWFAVETVTAGSPDPCGPLTTADGDGLGTQTPGCTQIDGDLWQRADAAGVEGYVLRRDGVTVTLAGPAVALPAAIGAARPAADADLWRRTTPASPFGWLLW